MSWKLRGETLGEGPGRRRKRRERAQSVVGNVGIFSGYVMFTENIFVSYTGVIVRCEGDSWDKTDLE